MSDDRDPSNSNGPVSPVGPVDALKIPRFAEPSTFARLPRRDQVDRFDVAVLGVPFDAGVTYRPGARFGPRAIRDASRLLRTYHPGLDVEPFAAQQVVDAGDVACNPFDIQEAIQEIEAAGDELLAHAGRLLTIGGDHTIALPLLRVMHRGHGPVALLHFDAHLDTWDTYFGAPYTHGTPFRRAWEEGLLLEDRSMHVGIRVRSTRAPISSTMHGSGSRSSRRWTSRRSGLLESWSACWNGWATRPSTCRSTST